MESLIVSPTGSLDAGAARCGVHPDALATGTCNRCGAFYCPADQVVVGGKPFCASCASRADVNYLEAFRLKYWGKRDGWAFVVGFGGLVQVVYALFFLGMAVFSDARARWLGLIPVAGIFAALAYVSMNYFQGKRWARTALLVVQVLASVFAVLAGPLDALVSQAQEGGRETVAGGIAARVTSEMLPAKIAAGMTSAMFTMLIGISIWMDTRNRLFFKIPVSEEKLKAYWHLKANNTLARSAFLLSFCSLLLGPLALVSLPMGIVALRRVNPKGTPPVGRRGQAIASIVLSGLGAALFLLILLAKTFPSPSVR